MAKSRKVKRKSPIVKNRWTSIGRNVWKNQKGGIKAKTFFAVMYWKKASDYHQHFEADRVYKINK